MSDVSRETSDLLNRYAEEVVRWNARINLVAGKATAEDIYRRHIADSLQIVEVVDWPNVWMDLGSGGGFPGFVAAIMLRDAHTRIVLVESDQRKCVFLRQTARKLGLGVEVRNERIEGIGASRADVISARALAPLDKLLRYAVPLLKSDGVMVFPKGEGWKAEVEESLASWEFDLQTVPSRTREGSAILMIRNARPR